MKYETKDSGARQEYESGMHRDLEDGKPRFDLLIPEGVPYADQMLTRFAALMERGAVKYTARNWELASGPDEMARFRSSALRHMMQWIMGEQDEDHAAAVFFNVTAAETLAHKRDAFVIPEAVARRALVGNDDDCDCADCLGCLPPVAPIEETPFTATEGWLP